MKNLNTRDVLRKLSDACLAKYKDENVGNRYATAFGYFEGTLQNVLMSLPPKECEHVLELIERQIIRIK